MGRQHRMAIVVFVSILAFSGGALAASGDRDAPTFKGQRHLKGTVEQIKGDQLQLNTGELAPRFIPLIGAREKGSPEIKIGDVIELTVNDQNLLVDYHLLDQSGQPVGNTTHHILQGQIALPLVIGHDRVLIRTKDGKETSFKIRTQARSKMASIPVGVDAVFMVDETNKIVDVNFASKEATEQAGRTPREKSPLKGAQERILGTVVEPLLENRITIRTPEGQEQRFEVRPSMRKRIATLPKGQAVVLLIDKDNHVADVAVHREQKHGR